MTSGSTLSNFFDANCSIILKAQPPDCRTAFCLKLLKYCEHYVNISLPLLHSQASTKCSIRPQSSDFSDTFLLTGINVRIMKQPRESVEPKFRTMTKTQENKWKNKNKIHSGSITLIAVTPLKAFLFVNDKSVNVFQHKLHIKIVGKAETCLPVE